MPKGLVPARIFVRRTLMLEGRDAEIARLYKRGYAMLTTNEAGEALYCFIFSNSTTFSDNLTRNLPGEKIEYGELVVDYTRDDSDEDFQEDRPKRRKSK